MYCYQAVMKCGCPHGARAQPVHRHPPWPKPLVLGQQIRIFERIQSWVQKLIKNPQNSKNCQHVSA
jgi:hypothetical protein